MDAQPGVGKRDIRVFVRVALVVVVVAVLFLLLFRRLGAPVLTGQRPEALLATGAHTDFGRRRAQWARYTGECGIVPQVDGQVLLQGKFAYPVIAGSDRCRYSCEECGGDREYEQSASAEGGPMQRSLCFRARRCALLWTVHRHTRVTAVRHSAAETRARKRRPRPGPHKRGHRAGRWPCHNRPRVAFVAPFSKHCSPSASVVPLQPTPPISVTNQFRAMI